MLNRYEICLNKTNYLIYNMQDFRTVLVSWFMPRLCVDHMIQQGVCSMGFSYPDPLAKSRPTGKIQTYWQNPDTLVNSRPTGWDTK